MSGACVPPQGACVCRDGVAHAERAGGPSVGRVGRSGVVLQRVELCGDHRLLGLDGVERRAVLG